MKNLFTLAVLMSIVTLSFGQSDTTWKKGGGAILNFNQTSLTNWAAGGESNLSSTILTNFYANYKFGKTTWDNTLNMNYGLITANNYSDIRKNEDRIELNSKYGRYAFADDFYYSGMLNFLTQFADGFDYLTDPEAVMPISKLLSPGYLTAAVGLDWKPSEKFSLFLSPATGKFTFVMDDVIASTVTDTVNNKNRYGVDAAENLRAEFGASMVAALNTPIGKNTSLSSKLTLFNNYTDPITEHRGNIDVDFQNNLNIKISKYFATTIFLQVLYDHDIAIATYNDDDVQIGTGPKTQFKEVFGIGLSYSFQ
ncbi:MAG TPA: DUF3078 domain-containing protein [Chitinophagales bacterium]|nr:DUF3078 domain-containing protein [Chitinophagales bacterium]HRG84289.1 DUF3078 domain-containing protein [Chitinophagales bacterium]HRH52062.1 DUF3078 domain-containing protein [Chitinophagales bacterium]